ncbi:chondroitinase-B domain-containing protein [Mucilaginibacter sp. SG564]|uniref:chondroitinase-B domain-containing protein n=1 Tax=unclassified Mucilaginibacter TaxID=2617802 RepID=UPI00155496F1|nr:chondroitinase-B domain-containing protein [Mucilaginibacter sp. SG564]NOW96244.1 parallel beta-helix repeat protein [Mucilaginibacter sp. SG564]
MKKNTLIILLALLFSQAAICKNFTVRSQEEFKTAVSQAVAGDVIIIANGTYTGWAVKVPTVANAAHPLSIRAETRDKVIFTGDTDQSVFEISGSYIVLQGLIFKGCNVLKADGKVGVLVEFKNSTDCRLTQCLFTQNAAKAQFTPLVIVSGTGQHNRVDSCRFISNIDNQELQIKITKEACPVNTLIENNIFENKAKVNWKVFNGGECVQIGQDPVLLGTSIAKSIVRYNRFINCNGEPEVISNKSSGNSYIHNYFENCEGELVMRGGHDCVIDSNVINGGTGGIRINGTGHIITHNTISNVKTGIRLMYGMGRGKSEIGFYIAASNCVIKNNHIEKAATGILVGDNKNADWTGKFNTTRYPSRVIQDVAPFDNTIGDNIFTDCGQTIKE